MINILDINLWEIIVRNMPIPAKDLLIYSNEKGLLMGKRLNKPAKDFYFVPGGRVFKNENKGNAIKRIASEEIDLCINSIDCVPIGTYDHFYDESIFKNSNIKTHYIVEAILIPVDSSQINLGIKNQHSELKWINQDNLDTENVHYYSKKYLFDIINI